MQRKFSTLEAGLVATGFIMPAVTVSAAEVCPVHDSKHKQQQTRALLPADVQKGAVYIEADQAFFRETGSSLLEGDVLIARNRTQLRADKATYKKVHNRFRQKVAFTSSVPA